VFHLDETYVNQGHSVDKAWEDTSIKTAKQAFSKGYTTGMKSPSGKGKRAIILHVGNENGFLPNAAKVWVSGSKVEESPDYHDDMCAETFKTWIKTSVLPNLPPKSVLVMDNAKYHCKKGDGVPNSKSLKADLQYWLTKNDIKFDKKTLKPVLWKMCQANLNANPKHEIDDIIAECGHKVLRLPPYHCELNPIGQTLPCLNNIYLVSCMISCIVGFDLWPWGQMVLPSHAQSSCPLLKDRQI
jgi:transposase